MTSTPITGVWHKNDVMTDNSLWSLWNKLKIFCIYNGTFEFFPNVQTQSNDLEVQTQNIHSRAFKHNYQASVIQLLHNSL